MELQEVIFTLDEAGAYAKVRPKTIRDWLRQGKLKGIKAGKLWRVRKTDLDAFLETSVKPRMHVVAGALATKEDL